MPCAEVDRVTPEQRGQPADEQGRADRDRRPEPERNLFTRRGQSKSPGFSSMRVNPDTATTDTPNAKAHGLADSPAPDAPAPDPPT